MFFSINNREGSQRYPRRNSITPFVRRPLFAKETTLTEQLPIARNYLWPISTWMWAGIRKVIETTVSLFLMNSSIKGFRKCSSQTESFNFCDIFKIRRFFSTSRRYTLGNFHRKLLKPKKDPRHHRNILENSIAIFPTSESVSRQKKGGGGEKVKKSRRCMLGNFHRKLLRNLNDPQHHTSES